MKILIFYLKNAISSHHRPQFWASAGIANDDICVGDVKEIAVTKIEQMRHFLKKIQKNNKNSHFVISTLHSCLFNGLNIKPVTQGKYSLSAGGFPLRTWKVERKKKKTEKFVQVNVLA